MNFYPFSIFKEAFFIRKKNFSSFLLAASLVVCLQLIVTYVPRGLAKAFGVYKKIEVSYSKNNKNDIKKISHTFNDTVNKIKQYKESTSNYILFFIALVTFILYLRLILAYLGLFNVALSIVNEKKLSFRSYVPFKYEWLFIKTSFIFFLVSFIFAAFILMILIPGMSYLHYLLPKMIAYGMGIVFSILLFLYLFYYLLRYSFFVFFILDGTAHTVYDALHKSYLVTEGKVFKIFETLFLFSVITAFVAAVVLYVVNHLVLYISALSSVKDVLFTCIYGVAVFPYLALVNVLLYEYAKKDKA